MLGEDEDWLSELSIDMFPGRRLPSRLRRPAEDGVTALHQGRHRVPAADHCRRNELPAAHRRRSKTDRIARPCGAQPNGKLRFEPIDRMIHEIAASAWIRPGILGRRLDLESIANNARIGRASGRYRPARRAATRSTLEKSANAGAKRRTLLEDRQPRTSPPWFNPRARAASKQTRARRRREKPYSVSW